MKILQLTLIFIISLSSSCSSKSNYDQGYEDAWEERKSSFYYFISSSYKKGYEEGLDDAYEFDKIKTTLDTYGGNLEKAAEALGLSLSDLRNRMEYLGIRDY